LHAQAVDHHQHHDPTSSVLESEADGGSLNHKTVAVLSKPPVRDTPPTSPTLKLTLSLRSEKQNLM
jgi:hypothetical protein